MKTKTILPLVLLVTGYCISLHVNSLHARPANYDTNAIAPYTLPDPLVFRNGNKVTHQEQWQTRRKEILEIFEDQMYGAIPAPVKPELEVINTKTILNGRAVRKQIRMTFANDRGKNAIYWLIYIPKSKTPVPAFIGLNYYGNHELEDDPDIVLTKGWLRNNEQHFIENNQASEKSRGFNKKPGKNNSWPFELLIKRGYALATACYGEIAPDHPELYTNGVHSVFPPEDPASGNNTTALAAWAWTLMRGMDMLEEEPGIDTKRVAVVGCSRLAKTALLAGAKDERFAVIIPNQTGGGGVPLAKRDYGENVALQNQNFPHWFCRNFRQYSDNESAMPFDQHLLLTACAPRKLYVSSFPGKWFDPYGEFLSIKAAEPVWQFLGFAGLPAEQWPPEMSPAIGTHLAYHNRPFKHGIMRYDWNCYLTFTDKAFGVAPVWNEAKVEEWHGFKRYHFQLGKNKCWIVQPENPRPGNHWIWSMRFPDAFKERTGVIKLVEQGFYYAYINVGNTMGSPTALRELNKLYWHLQSYGFNPRATLIALSRGGLFAYRYATTSPEHVMCIYGDAPVCDFKSWPAGKGTSAGSASDWQDLLTAYNFKSEGEALSYLENPVDTLATLAAANIPLIHVTGELDINAPVKENTDVVLSRYQRLGGTMTVFRKPDVAHHPHGLEDPTPVVNLISAYATRRDIEDCQ